MFFQALNQAELLQECLAVVRTFVAVALHPLSAATRCELVTKRRSSRICTVASSPAPKLTADDFLHILLNSLLVQKRLLLLYLGQCCKVVRMFLFCYF
jgi:hypothetical protein